VNIDLEPTVEGFTLAQLLRHYCVTVIKRMFLPAPLLKLMFKKNLVKRGRLGGIFEIPLQSLSSKGSSGIMIKHERYVLKKL
jgi:hypothetical protein